MPDHPARSFDFRLHQVAVVAVFLGVLVGLIAATVQWANQGVVDPALLNGLVFAVVAAYPVWRVYRKKVLAEPQAESAS